MAPLPDERLELGAVDEQGGLFTTRKLSTDPNANWAPWSDFLSDGRKLVIDPRFK